MSLPAFKFKDLVNEEWENSNLFNYFSETIFLFVVYKKENNHYILNGSQFWNMPYKDLDTIVKNEWIEIRDRIKNGITFSIKQTKSGQTISNNLPKKDINGIIHIRPHSQKSAYLFSNGQTIGDINKNANELPDGQWMTTQSFWINNKYILEQLNSDLIL